MLGLKAEKAQLEIFERVEMNENIIKSEALSVSNRTI